jgi:hypothetical protein
MGDEEEETEKDEVAPKEEPIGSLTNAQQKALSDAIEQVKQRVFVDVTKRMKIYLLAGVTLLSAFGIISIVGFKTAIKDAVVASLRDDPTLRQDIKEKVVVKVTEADGLIAELKRRIAQAEADKTDGNVILQDSLQELNGLIDQLKSQQKSRIPYESRSVKIETIYH